MPVPPESTDVDVFVGGANLTVTVRQTPVTATADRISDDSAKNIKNLY
jgi:hypothetical protein